MSSDPLCTPQVGLAPLTMMLVAGWCTPHSWLKAPSDGPPIFRSLDLMKAWARLRTLSRRPSTARRLAVASASLASART